MDVNEILKLSEAERILAVERIWDSLDHTKIKITDPQKKELNRRVSAYREGKVKFFSWDEVKSELHTRER